MSLKSLNKIKTIDEVVGLGVKIKAEGKTIVTTNGSFDILHPAHVNLLEKSKNEGDVLVVLLNSDSSIRRNKGEKRPILAEQERARIIASLGCVDYVVIFDDPKPLEYLKQIRPDIHTKGAEDTGETRALLETWGGRYKLLGIEEGFSTTSVIERVLEKYKNS
ncbi:MAG: adenylyltransferase/cytidyltransferase family protein [Candidatus Woesearchaeota archaeon]